MNTRMSREHLNLEWEHLLAERFLPGRVELQSSGPGGRLDGQTRCGHLWLAHLSVQPQSITHADFHLDALTSEARSSLIVHVVDEGTGFIEQGGTRLPFGPGNITYRTLAEPSRIVFDRPGRFYAMHLPAAGMRTPGNHTPSCLAPRVVNDATLPGVTARRLLHGLMLGDTHDVAAMYLSFALPWLFAAAYHDPDIPPSRTPSMSRQAGNESRWQQALRHIEQHLFEADDLSAGSAARAIGVSQRYLHQLFALRGLRFSRVVLERRLDAARAMLTRTSRQTHSIASIAYQCGFRDPAHFSRLFKQRYGISPKACRTAM